MMVEPPRKIPVVFYRTAAGAEVVRLAERPRPRRPRRNWPGPDARAVPLAGRHAAVPVAGARPLGSAQRPAEPSHCAGAILRCWRADRRAAWLHQEDAEDATG